MLALSNNGPNVMWLEDRIVTAKAELAFARKHGYVVHEFATPASLMAELEETFGTATPDKSSLQSCRLGFIIDLMLIGVMDMRRLKIEDAQTNGGMNAGYVFVDRVLRRRDAPYFECPVCFVTERIMDTNLKEDIEVLCNRGGGQVVYARKYCPDGFKIFREFLSTL